MEWYIFWSQLDILVKKVLIYRKSISLGDNLILILPSRLSYDKFFIH